MESPEWVGKMDLLVSNDSSVEALGKNLRLAGSVDGRQLLLTRETDVGMEMWAGWLTRPPQDSGSPLFVAGTIIRRSEDQVDGPWGWFAVAVDGLPESSTPDEPPVPDITKKPNPRHDLVALPAPVEVPTIRTPVVNSEQGSLGFVGDWRSSSGEDYRVTREGQKLVVQAPDGRMLRGRITGTLKCVVGLGRGCCAGSLEGGDTIRWQNGSLWERTPLN